MNKKEIINSIASELVGIEKSTLSKCESNIVDILIEANVLKYENKHDETIVSWVKK